MHDADLWAPLRGHKYISFETFKKNGDGVKTPIWFERDGDTLVFMTSAKSWKVKRLRRDARCRLAACNFNGKTILGPWLEGTCRRIEPAAEVEAAYRLLARKYLSLRLVNPIARLIGRTRDRAYYRIWPGPPDDDA